MSKGLPVERRSHPRVKVDFSVNLSCDASLIATQMKNLSCSGACCIVDKYIAPMTKEAVLIFLREGNEHTHVKKIECKGVVVRCESLEKMNGRNCYQAGIYFLRLNRSDQECIYRYIQH